MAQSWNIAFTDEVDGVGALDPIADALGEVAKFVSFTESKKINQQEGREVGKRLPQPCKGALRQKA